MRTSSRRPLPHDQAAAPHGFWSHSNQFDVTIASLGLADHGTGLHRPCSRLRIDRIRLALPSPRLAVMAVGTLDFDDGQTTRTEPARQPGTVTPRSLDPDLLNFSEVTRPRQEHREARRRRRDAAGAQAPAELIQRYRDMLLGVGVDPDRHPNLAVPRIAAI